MKKFERKTVTVSVTPEEYDAVSHAISEYFKTGYVMLSFHMLNKLSG